MLDLARELEKHGHDVRFYSYISPKRAESFGFPGKNIFNLFPLLWPLLALRSLRIKTANRFIFLALDFFTSLFLRKADIVIAMSGVFCKTLEKAKKQGAILIVERGSKHILEQKKILDAIAGGKSVPEFDIKRELHDYKIADFISVAATHVKDSFLNQNFPKEKLFVNPYGVELSDFYSIKGPKPFDVIMVGNWSLQKGCDILSKACKNQKLTLLHVGPIANDCELPSENWFTHVNKVDQKDLYIYYNQAKVFAIASRQEGMALVQMQAMACGLPLVCSPHSGGVDIGIVAPLSERIFPMEEMTVSSLEKALLQGLQFAKTHNYSVPDLSNLSWEAYGNRYNSFISKIMAQ